MKTPESAPLLIVGGGVAGLGLAWALSRTSGRSITVLEREEQPFRLSSAQNAAILRTAIDAPATRALTRRTAELLRTPPADLTDRPLVDRRGLIVVEGRTGSPLPWWAEEVTAAGEARLLEDAALEELWPAFRREGARAWLFPEAGTIDISRLGASLHAAILRAGVTVRTGVEVRRLLAGEGGQRGGAVRGVELASGEQLEAATVCLAAGAWAGALGATVGASFPGRPTRRHLFTTHRDERVDPAAPIVWDDAAPFYCRPERGGLLACVGDLDDCPPLGSTAAPLPVDSLVVRAARRALAERLPGLPNLQLERGWAAVRTLTEDDTPVVGFDPTVAGLFWCGALGGHGMSLSLGLAELAARLLSGEQDPLAAPLAPDAPRRAWAPERDWRESAAPAGTSSSPA